MIYTSYFAKIRKLPDNIVPVSICAKPPKGYQGLQYKKLAPSYDILMRWKENHDNAEYIRRYKEQVLDKLNAVDVILDLSRLVYGFNVGEEDICLVCYEKSEDFCHRHLVVKWLREHGFEAEEWTEH
jgi:uncharacterized protein YeaO (DUF488 family)